MAKNPVKLLALFILKRSIVLFVLKRCILCEYEVKQRHSRMHSQIEMLKPRNGGG